MLESLLYGTLTGIALCLTFGTVFFSLVQNSVDNGYKTGVKIAFGVLVCDIIFVFFAIYGTALLPDIPDFKKWMAGAGVVFLIALGLTNIIKGQPQIAYPKTSLGNLLYYFTTGFLLNGLNPVNFISWVTIASYLRTNLHYNYHQVLMFFGASVVVVFFVECGIAIFAHRLKRVFTPKVVTIFNKVTGVVFILIACQIAYVNFLS
ncbi:LysE family transporter [Dyadobacter chenwenxiniae]|uniref:LysE family transporter n=1 Tax=Dyadobacter chenwenxiniae TaxID=2906456 RepID=A0A9X1PQ39_9BACT|nr:LysE family transporter [Dyadobacter chenwenxiniae]MCF0052047.1 LysE family transporter [Dyadobacter chenwenxiniae]MCF0062781.1 LysE family transporter [Dyadobacter chenwenxiniae]UON85043.1 LysE family transporter [Dyadobacter chenwenxiniae]